MQHFANFVFPSCRNSNKYFLASKKFKLHFATFYGHPIDVCVRFYDELRFSRDSQDFSLTGDLTWIEPIGVAANEVGEVPGFGPRHEETAGTGSLAHYRYWKNENTYTSYPYPVHIIYENVTDISNESCIRYLLYFSGLRIRIHLIRIRI